MEYHVSKFGNDKNTGSKDNPFFTIQRAANVALAGDTVIVHEGIYREQVSPCYGGKGEGQRIVYTAAKGEKVHIKGSEIVKGWEKEEGSVWKKTLPNSFFGKYNPFAEPLVGDWVVDPFDVPVHLGDVYLNGKSFFEAFSLNEVKSPKIRTKSIYETWSNREEKIADPESTVYQWFAKVGETETTVYANFHDFDPNKEEVEISVRKACFYPEKTGLNYITVRGFEMSQAATPWAPPTADQPALLGAHWSKGWIIEDNLIHDSKCNGISIGKESSTGDNSYTKWNLKSGYQTQMESVFKAKKIGWSKENIGSHIIRNNLIYNCGQTGIVGNLGCVFSQIYNNEIHHIGTKHEFYGHEIGGIKLHASIDVIIKNNYIHHCSLGTWLDWEAQGTRVSKNVYANNNRDLMIEVTHGPCLVDNNILLSPFSFVNAAQGTALVHNTICGFIQHYPILDRSTPYHFHHSTDVMGTTLVYGNDDRFYQNLFIGAREEGQRYGTEEYNGAPTSVEEYVERVKKNGHGDVQLFAKEQQPFYAE